MCSSDLPIERKLESWTILRRKRNRRLNNKRRTRKRGRTRNGNRRRLRNPRERTDRWDIAIDAMDKVNMDRFAKRENKIDMKDVPDKKDGSPCCYLT